MVSKRLGFLIRRNAGRLLRREWESILFSDLGLPSAQCRFLELEESDAVRERTEARFSPRGELRRQAQAANDFKEKQFKIDQLDTAQPLLPGDSDSVYVLFLDSDRVGVLLASVAVINQFWGGLVKFQEDGFVIVDTRLAHKLVLQVLDSEGQGRLLDIAVWGRSWVESLDRLSH